MLIACISLVGVLILFVAITFFMTYKRYQFEVEGGKLRVQTMGSHLKIFFNDNLIKDVFSPQLFNGEQVSFNIGEKEFQINCKCNKFGNKLKVEILDGEKIIATNGVELKNEKK